MKFYTPATKGTLISQNETIAILVYETIRGVSMTNITTIVDQCHFKSSSDEAIRR